MKKIFLLIFSIFFTVLIFSFPKATNAQVVCDDCCLSSPAGTTCDGSEPARWGSCWSDCYHEGVDDCSSFLCIYAGLGCNCPPASPCWCPVIGGPTATPGGPTSTPPPGFCPHRTCSCVSPLAGFVTADHTPTFTMERQSECSNAMNEVFFRIWYGDTNDVVAAESGWVAGSFACGTDDRHSWTAPHLDSGDYNWRVWGRNSCGEKHTCCGRQTFTICSNPSLSQSGLSGDTCDTTPSFTLTSTGVDCYPHDGTIVIREDPDCDGAGGTNPFFVVEGGYTGLYPSWDSDVFSSSGSTWPFTSSSLTEGCYIWHGYSRNTAGTWSAYLPWESFEVISTPSAPSDFSCTSTCDSHIDFSWTDNSSNEDGFEIWRAANPPMPPSIVVGLGSDETSYPYNNCPLSGLDYFVRSYNACGFNDSSTISCSCPACPTPTPTPTPIPICGNRIVEGTEECDPPGCFRGQFEGCFTDDHCCGGADMSVCSDGMCQWEGDVCPGNICQDDCTCPGPTLTPTPTPPCPACPADPPGIVFTDVLRPDGNYNKRLDWTDVSGEEGYFVDFCEGVGCNPSSYTSLIADETSYTHTNDDNGFTPGTYLRYEIRPGRSGCFVTCPAYDNEIPTPTPTGVIPTPTDTPIPTPTPACPGCPWLISVACVEVGDGTCNNDLHWFHVNFEASYDIYRDGVYRTSVGPDAEGWVFWTDPNVPCGASYSYEAAPVPLDGACPDPRPCSTDSCTCSCPTPTPTGAIPTPTDTPIATNTPPPPTSTPTPCPVCPNWVTTEHIDRAGDDNFNKLIRWHNVSYEQGFHIYRCFGAGCAPAYHATVGINTTSYTDTNSSAGFTPGTYLRYRIRPYRLGCPGVSCSNYNNQIPTLTPTPTGVIPTSTPTPIATNTPPPTSTPTPCPACTAWVTTEHIDRAGDDNFNKLIRWNNVPYERGYRIYRCSGVGCSVGYWTTIGRNRTSCTDTNSGAGFAPGTYLKYEVRPYQRFCPILNCPDHVNQVPTLTPTPTLILTPTPTCIPVPPDQSQFTSDFDAGTDAPSNGDEIVFLEVIFDWDGIGDWGEWCWNNDPHFDLYVESADAGVPGFDQYGGGDVSDLMARIDLPASEHTFTFNEANHSGECFVWQVGTDNGDSETKSGVWNFCIDTNPDPWYQTVAGDIHSEQTIDSEIPSNADDPFFSLDDLNLGDQGLVTYGGGTSPDFGSGQVSSDPPAGWLVGDSFGNPYGFSYYYQKLDSPTGETLNNGSLPGGTFGETNIYYSSDAVTLNGGTIASGHKVILLIGNNSELTITGDISVNSGGYLGVFASGNINIEGSVTNLEGFYFTEATINTGESTNQLIAEGIFVADDFYLGRSLADNRQPAERFYYRPDLVVNAPIILWRTPQTWQELAP